MATYQELREILIKEGYKCVDVSYSGDEVFRKGNFSFAVTEVEGD